MESATESRLHRSLSIGKRGDKPRLPKKWTPWGSAVTNRAYLERRPPTGSAVTNRAYRKKRTPWGSAVENRAYPERRPPPVGAL